jgi:hypothetical protein
MDATQIMTIRFTYTPSDAVDAFRLYEATTPMRKMVRAVAVLSFAFAGLDFYAYVQLARTYGGTYGMQWFGMGLLVAALIGWFDPIRPLQAWLTFRMNSKIYTDQSEVTFDEAGVHARTSTYDAKRPWAAYSSVLESNRLFLLVYGKGLYATIPKRAFSDDKQIQVFRDMLQRKIGKFG